MKLEKLDDNKYELYNFYSHVACLETDVAYDFLVWFIFIINISIFFIKAV